MPRMATGITRGTGHAPLIGTIVQVHEVGISGKTQLHLRVLMGGRVLDGLIVALTEHERDVIRPGRSVAWMGGPTAHVLLSGRTRRFRVKRIRDKHAVPDDEVVNVDDDVLTDAARPWSAKRRAAEQPQTQRPGWRKALGNVPPEPAPTPPRKRPRRLVSL